MTKVLEVAGCSAVSFACGWTFFNPQVLHPFWRALLAFFGVHS